MVYCTVKIDLRCLSFVSFFLRIIRECLSHCYGSENIFLMRIWIPLIKNNTYSFPVSVSYYN
jgi:hypothetical protein